jgi:membrane protein
MAHKTQEQREGTQRVTQTLTRDAKLLGAFWTKFNNDWSWNNSAGLAYNLILSLFPQVVAIVAILGISLGNLDNTTYMRLVQQITTLLPEVTSSRSIIDLALRSLKSLHQQSIWLLLFAVALAIFNGSRLFLFLEGTLDIIYHVRPRSPIRQNIMAVLMLLLYVVLVPIIFLASSVPALVASFLQRTQFSQIPGSGWLLSLSGIAGGLIAAYLLFQAIYIVVPNQKISLRHSWLGALTAAVLLELYIVLFPLYVSRFLSSFASALGLLILLIFFYYFAMILYLGAEVNSFFSGKVRATPYDIATMVHVMTSHLATSEKDVQEQASIDHKQEKPKEVHEKQADSDVEGQQQENESGIAG